MNNQQKIHKILTELCESALDKDDNRVRLQPFTQTLLEEAVELSKPDTE